MHGEGSSFVFCCPQGYCQAILNYVHFPPRSSSDPSVFAKLGGRRVAQRKAVSLAGTRELCWLFRPGHATGWGYGSVNEGKRVPERLHTPCPVRSQQRVQPVVLRNHKPGSHQRALLRKMGGTLLWNVAQWFPTWGSVWKPRLSSHKDVALLSSIFGFSQLARKQHLNSLLYLVASAQLQLHAAHQKGQRRRQLVNSPLDFVFLSSIWVCIQLNPSQSHLPVTFYHNHVYLVKQVERTQVHPCIWVCRTSIPYGEIGLHLCELLPASSETPFGLKFHETERFFSLIPFFACDFPDARLDMPLTKKLAEFGAQKKGRFCA